MIPNKYKQYYYDIQDVNDNGYYHNMKFKATAETQAPEETALAIIPKEPLILNAAELEEASTMEISYNVTGPRRKELAAAVGDFIGTAPVYQEAPTYAFAIGNYIIDRNDKL